MFLSYFSSQLPCNELARFNSSYFAIPCLEQKCTLFPLILLDVSLKHHLTLQPHWPCLKIFFITLTPQSILVRIVF